MLSAECVEDGVCGFDPTCGDECCAGACRILPGPAEIGESCVNQNVTCVEGSFCVIDPMTFQRTVCGARAPLGAACGDGFTECVEDGFCDFDVGLCQPRRGDGELCDGGNSCQEGLFCDWVGDDYIERRCRAAFVPVPLGGACEPELGAWGCAEHGVVCSQAGVCIVAPGPGEPCVGYECAAYAECSNGTTCVGDVGLGESCGWDASYDTYTSCAGDLVCEGGDVDGVCVEPTFAEDACEVPGEPFKGSGAP